MLCGHGPGAAIRAPGQTSRHVGATAVDLVPLDPEALKDVRLVLGAGEEFERDDHDPRHDRADREDDSERDAVRGEEHREAEDDEGERRPDEEVAVPEAGRTPTVTVQHRAEVGDEVRPPEPERDRGGR